MADIYQMQRKYSEVAHYVPSALGQGQTSRNTQHQRTRAHNYTSVEYTKHLPNTYLNKNSSLHAYQQQIATQNPPAQMRAVSPIAGDYRKSLPNFASRNHNPSAMMQSSFLDHRQVVSQTNIPLPEQKNPRHTGDSLPNFGHFMQSPDRSRNTRNYQNQNSISHHIASSTSISPLKSHQRPSEKYSSLPFNKPFALYLQSDTQRQKQSTHLNHSKNQVFHSAIFDNYEAMKTEPSQPEKLEKRPSLIKPVDLKNIATPSSPSDLQSTFSSESVTASTEIRIPAFLKKESNTNPSLLKSTEDVVEKKKPNFFAGQKSERSTSQLIQKTKPESGKQSNQSKGKRFEPMRNIIQKKNSVVQARKLDEESPEKVLKQRQISGKGLGENACQFKKKPDLVHEVDAIVNGKKQEEAPVRTITIEDFQIVEKIGKGAYGDVFLAQERKTKFLCVIKALSKKKIKDLGLEEHVFREIKIQSYLKHRHLTTLYGFFHDENKIYLVLEFMSDGSMSSNGKKKISEGETAYLLQQVCDGLLYLHREDIIHRDIKPQNLLMNNHYVKIGDFGCSVFGNSMRKTVVGCLAYISPEQLTNNPYDDKIDAWSVGILGYELLVGRAPFQDKIRALTTKKYQQQPEQEIKKRLEESQNFTELNFPPEIKLSPEAIDFIKKMLDPDPVVRADLKSALKHKFIQKSKQYQSYLDSQL